MYLDVEKLRKMGPNKRARVFIDGDELDRCVECDTKKGYAITADIGDLMHGMTDIPRKTHYGTVTIEIYEV